MAKFETEKRLFLRKILFVLVLIMNETMIHFFGKRVFFNYQIQTIGKWIRVALLIFVILSALIYFKEKAITVETE